jgi:uncharacterized protein YukE
MVRDGGGGGPAASGNRYPLKTAAVTPCDVSSYKASEIEALMSSLDPQAAAQAGSAHTAASATLSEIAESLIQHVQVLNDSWSGSAAQASAVNFQQLHDTAIGLSQASAQTGSVLSWLGETILPFYKNYKPPGNGIVGDVESFFGHNPQDSAARQVMTRLNNRLTQANSSLPPEVTKNLPTPKLDSGGHGPMSAGAGGSPSAGAGAGAGGGGGVGGAPVAGGPGPGGLGAPGPAGPGPGGPGFPGGPGGPGGPGFPGGPGGGAPGGGSPFGNLAGNPITAPVSPGGGPGLPGGPGGGGLGGGLPPVPTPGGGGGFTSGIPIVPGPGGFPGEGGLGGEGGRGGIIGEGDPGAFPEEGLGGEAPGGMIGEGGPGGMIGEGGPGGFGAFGGSPGGTGMAGNGAAGGLAAEAEGPDAVGAGLEEASALGPDGMIGAAGAESAAAGEAGGMPMMGAGAGGDRERERQRQAWMAEEEDVWNPAVGAAPPVIGT